MLRDDIPEDIRELLEAFVDISFAEPDVDGEWGHGQHCRNCGASITYPYADIGKFHEPDCPVLLAFNALQ